ncbi:hypothetical protein J6590_078235 [Homalodisca vitripennis]|nr:hypothetical protein J6590_078235 [Homalodisca vitripennis]
MFMYRTAVHVPITRVHWKPETILAAVSDTYPPNRPRRSNRHLPTFRRSLFVGRDPNTVGGEERRGQIETPRFVSTSDTQTTKSSTIEVKGFSHCLIRCPIETMTRSDFRCCTRDHFWLVYTFQLNLPLGAAKTDVSLKSGQPYGYPGAAHH